MCVWPSVYFVLSSAKRQGRFEKNSPGSDRLTFSRLHSCLSRAWPEQGFNWYLCLFACQKALLFTVNVGVRLGAGTPRVKIEEENMIYWWVFCLGLQAAWLHSYSLKKVLDVLGGECETHRWACVCVVLCIQPFWQSFVNSCVCFTVSHTLNFPVFQNRDSGLEIVVRTHLRHTPTKWI